VYVYRTLVNRKYIGEIVYKDQTYPGGQEAIVDRKTLDRAHRVIAENTRAMSDAMATLGEVLGRYQDALPYPSGTCGVVAADAFDSPSTLEAIWGRLVASYAIDAEATKDQAGKTFTAKAAEVLLEHVAEEQCQAFGSVGLGRDLRFEADDVLGQALHLEDRMLHLSVFPPMTDRPGGAQLGPGISPPSRRRR